MPAIDAAIESGNVHALAALGTRGGYPLQTLFFEWSACTNDGKGNGWLHPRSLEWFANDASLHDPLRAMSESFFHRDYSAALFTANIPLWWDAPNALGGADAILSMTKQWCALDAGMTSTEKGVQSALVLLAALNKRDSERVRHDPVGAPRNHLAVRTLVGALEQSVDVLCARFDIPIALMRTLAGRMTMQDMENPVLCAVAHHDTDHFNDDVPAFPQYKAPLGAAQRMQIAHNASFAEPLPTLLDMQGWSGNPWVMYCLAEPFVKQRPVATLALPDNVLDAPPW